MVAVWLVCAVIFGIVELNTEALVSVWFLVGAVVSAVVAYFGGTLFVQVLVFLAVSAVGIALFFLLFKEKINKHIVPTNLDRLKQEICVVTEEIDTVSGAGRVDIKGQSWAVKVKNPNTERIAVGTRLRVVDFEGVKAVVETL